MERTEKIKRIVGVNISIAVLWFASIFVFVLYRIIASEPMYLILLYSVPTALVIWLIQNSNWGNRKKNFHILSALIWTVLASVCFSIYFCPKVLLAAFPDWFSGANCPVPGVSYQNHRFQKAVKTV